jgi:hypothetical protein
VGTIRSRTVGSKTIVSKTIGSRAVSGVVAAAVLAGFCLMQSGTAQADPVAQANQIAAHVQAVTGVSDVVSTAQSDKNADSAVVARVAGGSVDVPKAPTEGVTITTSSGARIGIGVPNADTARRAATSTGGTTVYLNPASNTATSVQVTTDGGVRQLFTLNDSSAPVDYPVPLTLPAGAQLVSNDAGGYDIVARSALGGAEPIASIAAPWATDAGGRSLPTRYSVSGDVLTQHIDTRNARFPVVADPHYTWGWISGTVYFNRSETARIARSSSAASLGGLVSWPFGTLFTLFYYVIRSQASTANSLGGCYKVSSKFNGSNAPWNAYTYYRGYCT